MATRYWYDDTGTWTAYGGHEGIWTFDGAYWGYLRGGGVYAASGEHVGYVWHDGLRLVADDTRVKRGYTRQPSRPDDPGIPPSPGEHGPLALLPGGITNLFQPSHPDQQPGDTGRFARDDGMSHAGH